MTSIGIVADSGCDLPPALLERYHIGQVPLIARFGDYELLDRPETRPEFWTRYNVSAPPQTSGAPIGAWLDAYQAGLEQFDELITVTITGGHSVTFNSASVAAADFGGRVHPFDSWSLSLGEGLLTLEAAKLAASGASAAEILAELALKRQRLHIYILLDTLEAIQRGGRLAPVMAAIKRMSSVLSIKPVLTMHEGILGFDGAVRSMKRGRRRLIESAANQPIAALAVAHTRIPDVAESLADEAAAATGFAREDILVAEAGPPLAVHAGPGALGLAFIAAR